MPLVARLCAAGTRRCGPVAGGERKVLPPACFALNPSTLRAGGCGQVFYCSKGCQEAHAQLAFRSPLPEPRSSAVVPHATVCRVLKQWGAYRSKWGADTESVLLGVLEVLAMLAHESQQQQQRGPEAAAGPCPAPAPLPRQPAPARLPGYGAQDFLLLQSHADEWCPEDRREWGKACRQLLAMMARAGWPCELPSEAEALHLCGRINANNFGVYSTPGPAPGAGGEAADGGGEAGPVEEASAGGSNGGSNGGAGPEAQLAGLSLGSAAAGDGAPGGAAPAAGVERKAAVVGRAVFPAASFLNHSCSPNCIVARSFCTGTVTALRDIEVGRRVRGRGCAPPSNSLWALQPAGCPDRTTPHGSPTPPPPPPRRPASRCASATATPASRWLRGAASSPSISTLPAPARCARRRRGGRGRPRATATPRARATRRRPSGGGGRRASADKRALRLPFLLCGGNQK